MRRDGQFLFFIILLTIDPVFANPQVEIKNTGDDVTQIGVVEGNFHVQIGLTLEEHKQALLDQKKETREQLNRLHRAEKRVLKSDLALVNTEKKLLQLELNTIQNNLIDIEQSYNKRIAFLEETLAELQALGAASGVNVDDLNEALQALSQGHTELADKLFAEIESKEKQSIERAAKAAFERGKIANERIKYNQAFSHFKRAIELSPKNIDYLIKAASSAGEIAKVGKEIEWNKRALRLVVNSQDNNPQTLAEIHNNLGQAYTSLGQYNKAIEHLRSALDSGLKNDNYYHLEVLATARNNLGEAYSSLGQYYKALEYHQLALATPLKWGKDHPSVGASHNRLGSVYINLGQYNKAIEHCQLALMHHLKLVNKEHPTVAAVHHNFGTAHFLLGQYETAIEYLKLALDSNIKNYGEDHPRVTANRSNLGSIHNELGQYKVTIEYFKLALNSNLKTYGEDHPSVAKNRNNLGSIYYKLGQYETAVEYLKLALDSNLKTYGEDHPKVGENSENLGIVYRSLGENETAVEYYQLALAVALKTNGEEHPNVGRLRRVLGSL